VRDFLADPSSSRQAHNDRKVLMQTFLTWHLSGGFYYYSFRKFKIPYCESNMIKTMKIRFLYHLNNIRINGGQLLADWAGRV